MLSKQQKMTIGLIAILGVVLLLLCITIPIGIGGEIMGGTTTSRILEETGGSGEDQDEQNEGDTSRPIIESPIASLGMYLDWHFVLIIIAMVSNTFNFLYPLIIFMQSFYYIGFLALEKGVLDGFFISHLNSSASFFGLVRLFYGRNTNTILPKSFINAGVQLKLINNMIPCFILIGILLLITAIVFPLNMALKSQKIRKFIVTLKSVWIGTMLCVTPHLCFSIGTSSMQLSFNGTENIIDIVIFAISACILITFIALFLVQIKKHVTHPSIEQLKKAVSITQILKSSQFKFDCLIFSNKYFYLQSLFKVVFYFFGIGVTHGYPKIGVGICLFGQLIQFIVFITNPPFIKLRHSIVQGYSFMTIMMNAFCMLIVDLNQVVGNHRVSSYLAYIVLTLFLVGVVGIIANLITDIVIAIKFWRMSNNIFNKKSNDMSLYDEQTNDKLNADDTRIQKSHSKSKKKKKGSNKQNQNDQMRSTSKTGIYSQNSQTTGQDKRKFNVQLQGDDYSIPKIRKVKKPRQI